ncbi:head-tail connector protein [Microbaculum marinum]|uniref:Head-tail connector protein n=1 Tax=Microbaculum marinum TaxID=1764581 RepID=A0AAW9RSD3_9HYPH
MTLTLVTPPAAEPLSRADAKAFLRLEHDDEDTLVDTLIAAARLHVEAAIRRVLVSQTWRLTLDGWPPPSPGGRIVEMPLSPVISVDTVTVYDAEAVPAVLADTAYVADLSSWPARILMREGTAPVAPGAPIAGIEVVFTAGYGEASDVPAPIVQAIRLLVAHWYEIREPVAFGGPANPVPDTLAALLAPYRAVSL